MSPEHSSTHEPDRHWFEDIADHIGPAYLRYSFTKGTQQEVEFIIEQTGLTSPANIVDVGSGPGRHALAFAKRGFNVLGVDISSTFVDLGNAAAHSEGLGDAARFVRADARDMASNPDLPHGQVDLAISLCQGAFGLGGPTASDDPQNLVPDSNVLTGIKSLLKPGGQFVTSAFSSYFQVKWLEERDEFNAATAVNRELTELLDEDRNAIESDLWTTCYTPRELRLMIERVGLEIDHIYSVAPGRYQAVPPTIDTPEFLVLGHLN